MPARRTIRPSCRRNESPVRASASAIGSPVWLEQFAAATSDRSPAEAVMSASPVDSVARPARTIRRRPIFRIRLVGLHLSLTGILSRSRPGWLLPDVARMRVMHQPSARARSRGETP